MTLPAKRRPRTFVALLLLLLAGIAARPAHADPGPSAFPLYYESEDSSGNKRDKGAIWPFLRDDRTTDTLTLGFHPLASYYYNKSTGNSGYDVIWPFFRYRFRPRTFDFRNFGTYTFFPLFWSGWGDKNGETAGTTIFLPLYYQGSDGGDRDYVIVLPIFFYGKNAHLRFFPRSRGSSFFAIFPVYGDFKGKTSRVSFFLWPLYVRSETGPEGDKRSLTSVVWPIFGWRSGKDLWGFRVWPLFSYGAKKDEFKRAYFLWPFGHWRDGRVSRKDPSNQRVRVFFPLYVDFKREKFHFYSIFPAYAHVKTKGRTVRGFLLAIFNIEDDRRKGVRDYRFLWFLFRYRVKIPATEAGTHSDAPEKRATTGIGLFPLYWSFGSEEKKTRIVLWPIWTQRYWKYREYELHRTQIPILYSKRNRHYPDGKRMGTEFFFPFFQRAWKEDGKQRLKSFHFWFLKDIDALDRNWSPLWTFWEQFSDAETGMKRTRIMRGLWDAESDASGASRWRFNLLFWDMGARKGDAKAGSHLDIFWGMFGTKTVEGKRRTRIFWIPV